MWIFLNDAALSIVADRDNEDRLLVRGRIEGDIDRVFPEAQVSHTPEFDYAYRAFIARDAVADVIARNIDSIQYDNFKNSIEPQDHARHTAYLNVWFSMRDYQEDQELARANDLMKIGRF